MINKLFVASTTRNKMPVEKRLGVVWDSLKFLSTPYTTLLLPVMLFNQAFVLFLSKIAQVLDRVEEVNIVCVDNFGL